MCADSFYRAYSAVPAISPYLRQVVWLATII